MTKREDDIENADYAGFTCWYLPDEDACPNCGSRMASNGHLDWCENDNVCGYSRLSTDAPLAHWTEEKE